MQEPAATVPLGAQQAAEAVRQRWPWVEASVWTERMLSALETGIEGGKWFRLIDKVWSARNLLASWSRVSANGGAAGVDQVTVTMFERHLEANLGHLAEQLRTGHYRAQAVWRVYIPKAGGGGGGKAKAKASMRPLGIPTVRDRVVQTALRHVLEPIFERDFAEHSYGFRPGRGCKDALRRVDALLKDGYTYVVDADLKSYFDTIPHQKLMERVREKVADGRVLTLIETFLTQGVMDGLSEWTPEAGSPQGAVVSPLLSNIYLDPLDHLMARQGWEMVRYADDFVILCRSESQALAALEQVKQWTASAGLTLHPEKTRIVHATQGGFDFLGYHFKCGQKWPRDKSLMKFKETVRSKTKRRNGQSLARIIAEVNLTTKGWFEYFKHSNRFMFVRLDSWIRMRLRSILRRRQGKRGRGRGTDHQRWTNASFTALGLFSLTDARMRAARQSATTR
jgi:RNA-directed DNA polymerase